VIGEFYKSDFNAIGKVLKYVKLESEFMGI
jgi:hypothetical protein